LANGADALGVATLTEALELRDAGIEAPILVLSYTPVHAVRQAIRHNITLTLYDLDMAYAYNRAARELGDPLRVHVKIDTGMGRLGLMPDDTIPFFRHLANMQDIQVEGVYTHFADADEDAEFTQGQLQTFKAIVNPLRASGFAFKYIHAANSAATLSLPESHLSMVRVGLAVYGLSPSPQVPVPEGFKPAMAWKTVVAQVKTLPPGHSVGYGRTYVTAAETRVAVLPVGYSHGLRRSPRHWGQVLVQGQFAPLIGRVSMEKTVIDVTEIPDVSIGDEVVLLGRQGDAEITADDIAEHLGTINYEVVTSLLARVPRQ
jgi:alanine racemase